MKAKHSASSSNTLMLCFLIITTQKSSGDNVLSAFEAALVYLDM